MNKIVVVGIVSIIIVAIIAGILILNHPNPSNYNNTNTIMTFPPTTVTPINTTTPPSSTTVTPITSTTSVNTTSTSSNTSFNLPMNTFYFIGENSTGYYYIFVLNSTTYNEVVQLGLLSNTRVSVVMIQNMEKTPYYIFNPVTIEKGDYVFVIGCMNPNANFSIGNSYLATIWLTDAHAYETQITYEGNWTGSLP